MRTGILPYTNELSDKLSLWIKFPSTVKICLVKAEFSMTRIFNQNFMVSFWHYINIYAWATVPPTLHRPARHSRITTVSWRSYKWNTLAISCVWFTVCVCPAWPPCRRPCSSWPASYLATQPLLARVPNILLLATVQWLILVYVTFFVYFDAFLRCSNPNRKMHSIWHYLVTEVITVARVLMVLIPLMYCTILRLPIYHY